MASHSILQSVTLFFKKLLFISVEILYEKLY